VEVVDGKPNLFQIVAALHSSCCLTGGLYSGQEQGNKYADDGNHDKKFNESETAFGGLTPAAMTIYPPPRNFRANQNNFSTFLVSFLPSQAIGLKIQATNRPAKQIT
jgi:hypothetical protein